MLLVLCLWDGQAKGWRRIVRPLDGGHRGYAQRAGLPPVGALPRRCCAYHGGYRILQHAHPDALHPLQRAVDVSLLPDPFPLSRDRVPRDAIARDTRDGKQDPFDRVKGSNAGPRGPALGGRLFDLLHGSLDCRGEWQSDYEQRRSDRVRACHSTCAAQFTRSLLGDTHVQPLRAIGEWLGSCKATPGPYKEHLYFPWTAFRVQPSFMKRRNH